MTFRLFCAFLGFSRGVLAKCLIVEVRPDIEAAYVWCIARDRKKVIGTRYLIHGICRVSAVVRSTLPSAAPLPEPEIHLDIEG